MAHKYAQLAFTDSVREMQQEQNSRAGYASMDEGEDYNFLMSTVEADFIAQRDSFYMASVSETNWPYVQHRGGPKGFLKVLDASTLGFADYKGNRQYVSAGNFRNNDRVSIIFVDYPNKRRLKLMGRISQVPENDWQTLANLEDDDYRAKVERGFIIKVEAFDWNCPQHITPRYTESELESLITPITNELADVKAQLKARLNVQQQGFSSKHAVLAEPISSSYPQRSGEGELPLVISGIRQLTPRIRAIELKHAKGEALPVFEAGAHLVIPIILNNGKLIHRHYSICSNPSRTDCYEIAVLNNQNDQNELKISGVEESGSAIIHRHFTLGLRLDCSAPQNYFPLEQSNAPVVLIAGGIGITPIKAMALTLTAQQAKFSLHYCGRSINEMAFSDRLTRQLGNKLHLYSAAEGETLNIEKLLTSSPTDAHFYLCGPKKMIDQLLNLAQEHGISTNRLHFERFFAGVDNTPDSRVKPFTVKLKRSKKTITVSAQESLLDAVLAQGINVPYSCKTGACKTCVVSVTKGNVIHKDECLTNTDKSNKLMCLCVSRAAQDTLELDI